MIDEQHPDYTSTPASSKRPKFHYASKRAGAPFVSVITPYFNAGPVFWDTVRTIFAMSFTQWEWVIVDDGSTNAVSLEQLDQVQNIDSRVRVIRQENSGPACARNRAAREARGTYLMQIDSDDLVEPTFLEKALWVLETQPQFAMCNSYNATFGERQHLWPRGFQDYEINLDDNKITNQAVIRRDAFLAAGGYDETISRGHEDWDFWLNLADAGYWGYTIPEYLTWYRWHQTSRRSETTADPSNLDQFHTWLKAKHAKLIHEFPKPHWTPSTERPHAQVRTDIPVTNPLEKPGGTTRVLMLVPWLEIGGADKFNLDVIKILSARGYEFTVATTVRSNDPWLHNFAQLTPDIFCLHRFLNYHDYPRFLSYLIESRGIDTVLITNSELGYALAPYLRMHHPNVALLDFTHSEAEWKNGGYPGMAVRTARHLDLSMTSTNYLKEWMVRRGAEPDHIQVCHTCIDSSEWCPDRYDVSMIRSELHIPAGTPIVLFVGRFSEEKRPRAFVEIMSRVAVQERNFVAVMVGTGNEADGVRQDISKFQLEKRVKVLGALPNAKVRELLAVGNILVVPSTIEGLALVLFECMAMETVPVAVGLAGHPELVTPECGYLIPRSTCEIDDYAAAIVSLIRDPQLRTRMSKVARERVAEHFDLNNLAEGMASGISRAVAAARLRPTTKQDTSVVDYAAFLAIENMRLEDVADSVWAQLAARTDSSFYGTLRRLRQSVLPIGSGRYEVYKSVRHPIRGLTNRLRGGLPVQRVSAPPNPTAQLAISDGLPTGDVRQPQEAPVAHSVAVLTQADIKQ